MAKISTWHFRHLLYVVWLKKACKRGVTGTPGPPPGYPYARAKLRATIEHSYCLIDHGLPQKKNAEKLKHVQHLKQAK